MEQWATSYDRGVATAEIAARSGVSEQTVRQRLRRHGVAVSRPARRQAERVAGTAKLPAFVLPEMSNQELVRARWYPELIDYLHMSLGTSTALGPSDVSAVKHWFKIMMTLQSAVSPLLAVLIIARAINLLP